VGDYVGSSIHELSGTLSACPTTRGKKLRFSFNRLVMSLDFSVEYNKVMGG
jgi:hypothetical protein